MKLAHFFLYHVGGEKRVCAKIVKTTNNLLSVLCFAISTYILLDWVLWFDRKLRKDQTRPEVNDYFIQKMGCRQKSPEGMFAK